MSEIQIYWRRLELHRTGILTSSQDEFSTNFIRLFANSVSFSTLFISNPSIWKSSLKNQNVAPLSSPFLQRYSQKSFQPNNNHCS